MRPWRLSLGPPITPQGASHVGHADLSQGGLADRTWKDPRAHGVRIKDLLLDPFVFPWISDALGFGHTWLPDAYGCGYSLTPL